MPQFLIQLRPARESLPEDATPDEQAIVGRHFQYLKGHLDSGSLILAGRTLTRPYLGLAVIEAPDLSRAEAILAADPAVSEGVFLGSVQEYAVALLRG